MQKTPTLLESKPILGTPETKPIPGSPEATQVTKTPADTPYGLVNRITGHSGQKTRGETETKGTNIQKNIHLTKVISKIGI